MDAGNVRIQRADSEGGVHSGIAFRCWACKTIYLSSVRLRLIIGVEPQNHSQSISPLLAKGRRR